MKALRIIIVSIATLIAVGVATFSLFEYFKKKPGGVFIDSSPAANVYIDGSFVGKTPYKNTHEAVEITVRLVPVDSTQILISYETKIKIVPGIQTIVRREFGTTEDTSSGDVISFDKLIGLETGLIVISLPENAQVLVDGLPQGFTPYKSTNISANQHQITVRAPGYSDRVMTVKTQSGFRLSLFAKLAKNVVPEPAFTPTVETKTYVQILTTPTGFLRIRSLPDKSGEEIAQVKSGTQYLYLDEDVATGWIKIQYEEPKTGLPNGITGWVSGQYVKKVVVTPEASNSAKLK